MYAPRRVPQSYPPVYLRAKLLPVLPVLASCVALGFASTITALPPKWRENAKDRCTKLGTEASERSQRIFFDQPGLDTLTVRALARIAGATSTAIRGLMTLRIALDSGRLRTRTSHTNTGMPSVSRSNVSTATPQVRDFLPLIPTRPYDALMTAILTAATAIGAMRAGPVHAHLLRDSAQDNPECPSRKDRPKAQLRRTEPPRTLSDMCADIDDMYWAMTAGTTLKITRVGEGEKRRWLISLPGTAHTDFTSDENPADMESNTREMIGLESTMRLGLVKAVHDAMTRDGIAADQLCSQPVLICGHSQGGIVAVALAAMTPQEAGLDVRAILATGTPGRRRKIRPEVVMVSVAHDQDVIPAMDGAPDRSPDHRVEVRRRLVRPKKSPLYYAHSSATYTETLRHVERKVRVMPWGKVADAVSALEQYLPKAHESTRVMFYEIWQEVLDTPQKDTADVFADLKNAADFTPVEYESAWAPAPFLDVATPFRTGLTRIKALLKGWVDTFKTRSGSLGVR